MERIYFYKMIADNGGAPCVKNGLLSLAICKPMIRSTACEGNLIIGFAADRMKRDNVLIYIARITSKLSGHRYYTDRCYAARGDRIYNLRGDRFVRRRGARHHPEPSDLIHDLGKRPNYPRANVLLSKDFRYFGRNGTADYKRAFPRIAKAVNRLGQGARVNHSYQLRDELIGLVRQLWREHPRRKVLGKPMSGPKLEICHRDGPSCVVIPPRKSSPRAPSA